MLLLQRRLIESSCQCVVLIITHRWAFGSGVTGVVQYITGKGFTTSMKLRGSRALPGENESTPKHGSHSSKQPCSAAACVCVCAATAKEEGEGARGRAPALQRFKTEKDFKSGKLEKSKLSKKV